MQKMIIAVAVFDFIVVVRIAAFFLIQIILGEKIPPIKLILSSIQSVVFFTAGYALLSKWRYAYLLNVVVCVIYLIFDVVSVSMLIRYRSMMIFPVLSLLVSVSVLVMLISVRKYICRKA